jgi:hypothetical protein
VLENTSEIHLGVEFTLSLALTNARGVSFYERTADWPRAPPPVGFAQGGAAAVGVAAVGAGEILPLPVFKLLWNLNR